MDRADWEESILKANSTEALENSSEYFADDRETYIFVYTGIIVFGTICYACHSFCFFQMCVRISVNLHDMLYQGITRAKMLFFNNNPSGRILNRFSRDIENVDSVVPHTLVEVLDVSTIHSGGSSWKTQFYHISLTVPVFIGVYSSHCDRSDRESMASDSGSDNDVIILLNAHGLCESWTQYHTTRSKE